MIRVEARFSTKLEEKFDTETSWFIRRSSVSSTCSLQSTSMWGQLFFFFFKMENLRISLQTVEKRPNVDYQANTLLPMMLSYTSNRTATATPKTTTTTLWRMTFAVCLRQTCLLFVFICTVLFQLEFCVWKSVFDDIFFLDWKWKENRFKKESCNHWHGKFFFPSRYQQQQTSTSSTHRWNFSMFYWNVFAISRSSVKSLYLLQNGYSINLTLKLWLWLQQVVKIYFIELNAKSKAISCVAIRCCMFLPPKTKWIELGRADAIHRQQTRWTEWINLTIAS